MMCKKFQSRGQFGPAPGNLVKILRLLTSPFLTFWIDSTDNFGVSSKILVPNGVQLHNRFFWQKKILAPREQGDEVFFRLAGKWSLTRTEVGWILRCFRIWTFVKHEVWNHISTLTQSNFSRFGYLNLLRLRRKSWYRRILTSRVEWKPPNCPKSSKNIIFSWLSFCKLQTPQNQWNFHRWTKRSHQMEGNLKNPGFLK